MDLLELLAECSIALGGFAAVHAVLRGSTGPRGDFRAWGTVVGGMMAFLMSLVPLQFAEANLSEAALWRASSAIGFLGPSAVFGSLVLVNSRLNRLGHLAQINTARVAGQALALIAMMSMLANVVGWPWPPGPFLYALGVILVIAGAVIGLLASFWLPLRSAFEKPTDQ